MAGYNNPNMDLNYQPPIGTRLTNGPMSMPTGQIPPQILEQQLSPQSPMPQAVMEDAGVFPGQQSFAQPVAQEKPKGNFVNNLAGFLAALGSVGGTVANVIGGIKGTGSPGDAAIQSGGNLLKMLADFDLQGQKKTTEEAKRNSVFTTINNSKADARTKETSMALASSGYYDDALKNLDRIYQEREIGKARVEGEIEKLSNPKLQNLTQQKIKDETSARREGDIAVTTQDTADYAKLVEKDKPTQNDKITMKVLEKRLGLTVGANNPIKIESSLRKDFNNEKRIKDLGETVRYVTTAEDLYNQYKGDPKSFKDLVGLDRAIIKSFEKSTEPGSVVMPSEAQGYQKMMSLRSKLKAMYETIDKGGSLTADVRDALMNNMQTIKGSAENYARDVINVYADKAKSAGIDPRNVLVEFNSLYKPAQETPTQTQPAQTQPVNQPSGNITQPAGTVGKVRNKVDGKMYYYDSNKNILGVAE